MVHAIQISFAIVMMTTLEKIALRQHVIPFVFMAFAKMEHVYALMGGVEMTVPQVYVPMNAVAMVLVSAMNVDVILDTLVRHVMFNYVIPHVMNIEHVSMARVCVPKAGLETIAIFVFVQVIVQAMAFVMMVYVLVSQIGVLGIVLCNNALMTALVKVNVMHKLRNVIALTGLQEKIVVN